MQNFMSLALGIRGIFFQQAFPLPTMPKKGHTAVKDLQSHQKLIRSSTRES